MLVGAALFCSAVYALLPERKKFNTFTVVDKTGALDITGLPDGRGGVADLRLNGEKLYTKDEVRELATIAYYAGMRAAQSRKGSYQDWEDTNIP